MPEKSLVLSSVTATVNVPRFAAPDPTPSAKPGRFAAASDDFSTKATVCVSDWSMSVKATVPVSVRLPVFSLAAPSARSVRSAASLAKSELASVTSGTSLTPVMVTETTFVALPPRPSRTITVNWSTACSFTARVCISAPGV